MKPGAQRSVSGPPPAASALPWERQRRQCAAVCEALEAMLQAGLTRRAPVDRELAAYLRQHPHHGARDRRRISEIVYAVFRWWGWLSALRSGPQASPRLALAAAVLELPAEREVLDGLAERCGLEPAVVEAVTAAPAPADRLRRLATAWNAALPDLAPETLVPAWTRTELTPPRPWPELIEWLQRRPPLWLRLQGEPAPILAELSAAGLEPQPHPRLPFAVAVGRRGINLFTLPVYRRRRVEVQDLASQAVGAVCAPRPGERWWDLCAGAGGKTLLLAQLLAGRGTVVATDVRERKLQELKHRARLAGFSNIVVRTRPGQGWRTRRASFDGVLVDAPCSGSGTWRRNPWARWSLRPADLEELTALQRHLLQRAAGGVKPGGVLVYATCSMFACENERIVRGFLAAHSEFAPEPFAHPLAEARTDGTLQIWPWDGDGDAMYVARLRRQSAPRPKPSTGRPVSG